MKHIVAGLMLLCLAAQGNEVVELQILHTNDIHGVIFPSLDLGDPGVPKPVYGGFARLAWLVRQQRRTCPATLLLDAGDFFCGSPEGNASQGAHLVKLMNNIGYDAVALGNHDFAHGADNLERLARLAEFPLLSANLHNAYTGDRVSFARSCVILELGKTKIGIIGLTPSSTEKLATAKQIAGLAFSDERDALEKYVKEAKRQGAKLLIVLSHLGSRRDLELAADFPVVDLFIGGHDHVILEPARRIGEKTYVAQVGTKGQRLGIIRIKYDPTREKILEMVSIARNVTQDLPVDSSTAEAVRRLAEPGFDTAIGRSDRHLTISEIGYWVNDLLRTHFDADVAFLPRGTIRDELDSGTITRREIYSLAPFEDRVYLMQVERERLQELVEAELGFRDAEFPISGPEIVYDPTWAAGGKIVDLKVAAAKPILKVVTTEYYVLKKKPGSIPGVSGIAATDLTVDQVLAQALASNPCLAYRAKPVYTMQKTARPKTLLVNVNKADQRELVALPMIGPTLAKRIIEYRTKYGPFRSLEDLKKVKGIGNALVEKIRVLIEF